MKRKLKLIVVLMTTLVIASVVMFAGCVEPQEKINESELRHIINETLPLIEDCKLGDIPIFRQGKCIVWDVQTNSLSEAHSMLPNKFKAKQSDSEITVFLVLEPRIDRVGTYSISHQPAYRQSIDVYVVYWPEKKVAGMHKVRSKQPPSSRQVRHVPEYGDPNLPIAKWIRSLPNIEDEQAIESLIQALNDGERRGRIDAAKALGIIGDEGAVESLILALKDEDSEVRRIATWALGRIGDERAVEPLIKVLNEDKYSIQEEAAEALGKIGDERAVEPLIHALKEDGYFKVRRRAAVALANIGEPAVNPLIQVLEDEDSRVVQNSAAEVLGNIGDERAIEPLIKILGNNVVPEEVKIALGKIGDPAVDPLIQALEDEERWVGRCRAAMVLGNIGDERAVEPLIQALKEDGNDRVRCRAAEALGKIGDKRAVEPLIQVLEDEDSWGREEAAEALGKIGDNRAVDPLIQVLEDEEGRVLLRAEAAEALGKIGDNRAVEPLIQVLEDEDSWWPLQEEAAEALEKIKAKKAGYNKSME